jgi:hypothetical protein
MHRTFSAYSASAGESVGESKNPPAVSIAAAFGVAGRSSNTILQFLGDVFWLYAVHR